jgi:hypothetical protein
VRPRWYAELLEAEQAWWRVIVVTTAPSKAKRRDRWEVFYYVQNLRVNHEYVSMHPQNIITRLQSGESWENESEILVVKLSIAWNMRLLPRFRDLAPHQRLFGLEIVDNS